MFTGIIQYLGTAILNSSKLTVTFHDNFLDNVKIGDSIAINGICLTVVDFNTNNKTIEFFVMEETLKITTMSIKSNPFLVNVELALNNTNKLNGHIVQGHIHETGKIIDIVKNEDNSYDFWIECRNINHIKYKDSICIDGISLTISEINNISFKISIIPHTFKCTTLGQNKINDLVNIEYNIFDTLMDKKIIFDDNYFMNLAIKESKKGRLTCAPNPWVGCIIVYHNLIIGKGYHIKAGTAHAETNAINNAIDNGFEDKLKDAKLYVTLEPCFYFNGKRTPACSELINKYQIREVIVGIEDPDPNVAGKGINEMAKNNINIRVGVLGDKIKKSLRSYIHHRTTKMPYIIIKVALSIDGYPCLQNLDSKWITADDAKIYSHKIRAKSQAIIVGTNTVINDNPRLDVRLNDLPNGFKQPLRVVIDQYGKIKDKNVFDLTIAPTLVITSNKVNAETKKQWEKEKINYHILPFINNKLVLKELLLLLGQNGILQCIVEGGPFLQNEFFVNELFQELHVYHGNIILGTYGKKWLDYIKNDGINDQQRYQLVKSKKFGNDTLSKYIKINSNKFNNLEKALINLRNGKPIILMDSDDRENEGDLVVGAESVTKEIITFFINNSSGIICVPMEESRAKKLKLNKMVENNSDPHQTPFTISCDHKLTKTGISAIDRTTTIVNLANDNSNAYDFTRPGHVYPLVSSKAGLFERDGHTEGSIELCKLANIKPIATIAELMNKDGTVKNYEDCLKFAKENGLILVTMKELKEYLKIDQQRKTRIIASCEIELKDYNTWQLLCYSNVKNINSPHKVLIKGNIYEDNDQPIMVRIHSECFTGDVLGSLMCDCNEQLKLSMRLITKNNKGIIIMPADHEGRGIGICNKIRAYRIMKNSNYQVDTYQANKLLGLPEDARNYDCVVDILKDLGINKIDLLTENTDKIEILKDKINKIIPLECEPNIHNMNYLKTKRLKNNSMNNVSKKLLEVNTFMEKMNNNGKNDGIKIGIISTIWYQEILDNFIIQLKEELNNLGIMDNNIKLYTAPGCFEIPYLAKKIIKNNEVNILICLGAVIKGETAHFEYISTAVINGLMNLQLDMEFPVINGILNCYDRGQAMDRFSKTSGLAKSLALSTIHMVKY